MAEKPAYKQNAEIISCSQEQASEKKDLKYKILNKRNECAAAAVHIFEIFIRYYSC